MDRDAGRWSDLRDYTFQRLDVQKMLDKKGSVTSTNSQLEDVLILGGRPYYRIVGRNGKPVSAKEEKKEQERLDKEAAKRAKETDADRAKFERERQKDRAEIREIPDAFDFTLLGEERIDGLSVWKIHAEPKPGYKPKQDILRKVRGDLWVEQKDYQWVRGEIEVIDTISYGWFILRFLKGAKVTFSQMRVNDEVWVPKAVHVRGDAKLLMKTFRGDIDVTYSNYRKFRTDSQILSVEETEAAASPQN